MQNLYILSASMSGIQHVASDNNQMSIPHYGMSRGHNYDGGRPQTPEVFAIQVNFVVDAQGNVQQHLLPPIPVMGTVVPSENRLNVAQNTVQVSNVERLIYSRIKPNTMIGLRIFSCLGLATFAGFLTYLVSKRV